MTPDEVLLVLNGMEPLDISQWEFAVVTEGVMEVSDHGRLAGEIVRLSEPNFFYPFRKGEILVLNESGREPFGEARKPSKWDVRVVHCDTLLAAQLVREAVLAGTWEDERSKAEPVRHPSLGPFDPDRFGGPR